MVNSTRLVWLAEWWGGAAASELNQGLLPSWVVFFQVPLLGAPVVPFYPFLGRAPLLK